jgi:hypothetical protein
MSLSLDNIITISVAPAAAGLQKFNLNTLLLITDELPLKNFDDDYCIYYSANEAAGHFESAGLTARLINIVFAQTYNVRTAGGYLAVAVKSKDETMLEALQRFEQKIYAVGILPVAAVPGEELEVLAGYIETGDHLLFYPFFRKKDLETAVDEDGTAVLGGALMFKALGFHRCRALYYHDNEDKAFMLAAAYASRALSVNFYGSNSVLTMHLKELSGIEGSTAVNQQLLDQIGAAGADSYVVIAGLNVIYSSGENQFFDQVYNLTWLRLDMAVNYFNTLKQTQYKIPQTEEGLESLKLAILKSCLQAVINGYIAPGSWQGTDYFGDRELFNANIEQMGFYIYALPLKEQQQTERQKREVPQVMVAVKESGAFHQGSLIIGVDY